MNKRIRKKRAKQLEKDTILRAKKFIALVKARAEAEVLMHKIFRVRNRAFFQGCVASSHESLKEHECIIPAFTNESVLSPEQQNALMKFTDKFREVNESLGVTMEVK